MGVMTAVGSSGRFTRADFEKLPEDIGDGVRYELLDGSLVVTPAPGVAHQTVVLNLAILLNAAAPPGRRAMVAPRDVYLPTSDILEPDVLVIDDDAVVDDKVQGSVPLLVVEVLSPSSRRRDVGDKLTAYRDAGVPSYWVVDPIDPRLRAWRLEDAGTEVRAQRASKGEYVEVADVSGDEEWTAQEPFAVTVRPVDLTR